MKLRKAFNVLNVVTLFIASCVAVNNQPSDDGDTTVDGSTVSSSSVSGGQAGSPDAILRDDIVSSDQHDAGSRVVSVPRPTNERDAGVASHHDAGSSEVPDASTPVVAQCSTPSPVPSDQYNWYTTNGKLGPNGTNEFFQLTTIDGFSEDHCTYTGRIRWFYEGADGFWEGDGPYAVPDTVFVLNFDALGAVKDLPDTGNVEVPWRGRDYNFLSGCGFELPDRPPCDGSIVCQEHACFTEGWSYNHDHPGWVGIFPARWDEQTNRPLPR